MLVEKKRRLFFQLTGARQAGAGFKAGAAVAVALHGVGAVGALRGAGWGGRAVALFAGYEGGAAIDGERSGEEDGLFHGWNV